MVLRAVRAPQNHHPANVRMLAPPRGSVHITGLATRPAHFRYEIGRKRRFRPRNESTPRPKPYSDGALRGAMLRCQRWPHSLADHDSHADSVVVRRWISDRGVGHRVIRAQPVVLRAEREVTNEPEVDAATCADRKIKLAIGKHRV